MTRGQIDSPKLDDRSWQELVDQAKQLIPKYTREWTDHGPGDLGITLIELFAWMMEVTLFRLNQVPRKNFIEFLNLLGITRDPATPATVWLRFQTNTDAQTPKELPLHFVCTTAQTEADQLIRFETEQRATLQPANLVKLLQVDPADSTAPVDLTPQLSLGPLEEEEFTLASSEKLVLLLGFDVALPQDTVLEIAVSALQPESATRLDIGWSFSDGTEDHASWTKGNLVRDETNNLRRSGPISGRVPAGWQKVKLTEEDWFWIAMTIHNPAAKSIKLRWKHLLFNSVLATSVTSTPETSPTQEPPPGELVGESTGEPFQRMELQHRPIYHDPRSPNPYRHLEVEVSEPPQNPSDDPTPVRWRLIDDLPEGDGRFFLLEPATGTIQFGDYDTTVADSQSQSKRHGRIPPRGSKVRVRYRYVSAGEVANVVSHKITELSPLGALEGFVQNVTNPGPAEDGSREESVEEALQRAPKLLRIRNRAVTLEDYEYLARESATDVYRARALGPKEVSSGIPANFGRLIRELGRVNVLILPRAPLTNRQPFPTENLIQEVQQDLDQRKTALVALTVTGPRYVQIQVDLSVYIFFEQSEEVDVATLKTELATEVTRYLHPVLGGLDHAGWDFGQTVFTSGLHQLVGGIIGNRGFVNNLSLSAEADHERPPEVENSDMDGRVGLRLADMELICSHTQHDIDVVKLNEKGLPSNNN